MTTVETEFKRKGKTDEGQDVDEFGAPDLSPQDYAEHTAQGCARAFENTKLIEIVEVHAGPGQIHLLGRVKKDNERIFMERVVGPVLQSFEASEQAIDGFVGKQFFWKNNGV